MDLQQIRQNISSNHYELRKQFLGDLTQILANSHTYNGPDHIITKAAKEVCVRILGNYFLISLLGNEFYLQTIIIIFC